MSLVDLLSRVASNDGAVLSCSLAAGDVLAVAFVDAAESSSTLLQSLHGLVESNHGLTVIVVPLSDDAHAASNILERAPRVATIRPKDVSTTGALRAISGLAAAIMPPEVSILQVLDSGDAASVICTDGKEALLRGDLTASRLSTPLGWRTNVYVARCWEQSAPFNRLHHSSVAPHSVRLHEDACIAARLYSGDVVSLRRLPSLLEALSGARAPGSDVATGSVCAYVNPPSQDEDDEIEEDSEDEQDGTSGDGVAYHLHSPAHYEIWLPAATMLNLGARDGDSIMIAGLGDVPEAVSLTLELLSADATAAAERALASLLEDRTAPPASSIAVDPIESVTIASLSSMSGEALARSFFGLPTRDAVAARATAFIAAVSAVRSGAIDSDDAREADVCAAVAAAATSASAVFGVDAVAAASDVPQSQAAYLTSMVAQSECRYIPVVQGQTLALADRPGHAGGSSQEGRPGYRFFSVAATAPRFTAVIVGPGTKLTVRA